MDSRKSQVSVIVSPLRSLMQDQLSQLRRYGVKEEEEYPSLTAHQHQKGHTVPKHV